MTTNRDGRTVDLVLAGAKAALLGLDASPQATPNVFALPADKDDEKLKALDENLPALILGESWRESLSFSGLTYGMSRFMWTMEILVLLVPGPFSNETDALANEALADPWPHAISDRLYQNRGVSVPGVVLGDTNTGVLLSGRKGLVPFNGTKIYFGMRLAVPVSQEFTQPMAI